MRLLFWIGFISFALTVAPAVAAEPSPQPTVSSTAVARLVWPEELTSTVDFGCDGHHINDLVRQHDAYLEAGDFGMLRASSQMDAEQMSVCYAKYEHPYYALRKMQFFAIAAVAIYRQRGFDADMVRYEKVALAAASVVVQYDMPRYYRGIYDDAIAALGHLAKVRPE